MNYLVDDQHALTPLEDARDSRNKINLLPHAVRDGFHPLGERCVYFICFRCTYPSKGFR